MKRVMLGAVAAFAAATVFADFTYYVRQNGGNDNNNGTSYETAFATYGKALSKAKTCNSTKTPDDTGYQIKRIYVYPGEYHVAPRNAEGKPYANNQEISIGAYNIWTIGVNDDGSGDERTPAAAGEVVLDGDNVMRCFTSQYPTGMRFYNLTMQNGLAAGSYVGNGGLLLVNGVNNVVSNCIFRNATANRGGAIYGSSGMSTPIYDSKFYNCAATNGNGGAIYYVNQASNNMDQRFVRCDFINCSASNGSAASGESVKGGVLYLPTSNTYTNGFYFTDCNFVSNSCSGCGGVFSGPVLWATNCTFRDNVANCDGSIGHTTVTGTYMPNRTNNFVDCVFVGNVAKALSGGDAIAASKHVGGLLVSYSDYATEVHRCLFANNVSYGFCGVIGRLDSGKQRIWMFDSVVTNNIIKEDVLDPIMEKAASTQKTYEYSGVLRGAGGSVVSNCIISGNSSYGSAYVLSLGDGSKVYDSVFTDNVGKECPGKTGTSTVWGGALSGSTKNLVRNCLICRNWRQSANGNGAAVFFDSKSNSSNRIENCTICDNLAKMDPEQYSVGPRLNGKGSVIVNSVCLGNKTEAGKEVNLCLQEGAVQSNCYYTAATAAGYKDPKFRDWANGDYRLRRTSPLRDAGQMLDWMTEGSLDLAGQGRVNGENPDIGCYEYWWYSTGILLFVQ